MGGAEHSLLLLLEHLDGDRIHPMLACNEGPLAERSRALGVATHVVPMPRLRRELRAPLRLARGVQCLASLIRNEGVDVVHSNVMRASLYAATAARLTGRPLVWHVRDIYQSQLYIISMAVLGSQAIAISRATALPLPATLPVEIVPNGVDPLDFDVPPEAGIVVRDEWGVPRDAPLVGIVGRLRPWKGQLDFLDAMARVSAEMPEARFVLVGATIFGGGETYEKELRTRTVELGLAQHVVIAGQRDDLPAVLSALDVVVHCSTSPEPFGRVIIEAMAARRPVVAYDQGGPSEIVASGETGLLVPPGDTTALARGVLALLMDPRMAQRLGEAGRRRVEEVYHIRESTRRIEGVLVRVAGGQAEVRS